MTEALPYNGAGIPLKDLANAYAPIDPAKGLADVAFQPPTDPLAGVEKRNAASIVYRDLPLVTIQNTWSVEQARGALYAHMMGIFESSSQLYDSILGDDRVTATLGSRISGLLGRPVRFKPGNDSSAAKEVADAWAAWWPRFAAGAGIETIHTYAIGLGFCPGQLVWDTSGPVWGPLLRPWHPRFTYFDWPSRRFMALSQDGQMPILPGNGKWVLHAPFGEYRGWIRGAVRALTEPWMLRHFAFRDMARFSEVHGLPARIGDVPAVSDPGERAAFEDALKNLGTDAAMILPQGVDGENGYDYRLVEAKDRGWQAFPGLMDRCEMAIVLALLYQNLTTEVQGGSMAAANVHLDIRQSGIQKDNASWRNTIYSQIARAFAYFNFGDPELAPWTDWDVDSRADQESAGKQFAQFSLSLQQMKSAGVLMPPEAMAKLAEMCALPLTEKDLIRPEADAQAYKYHFDYGVLTLNEARARLGLKPIEGGDEAPEPIAGAAPSEPTSGGFGS